MAIHATSLPRRQADKRVPPQLYFGVSAVFHYMGPAFAVLLFAAVQPLGVAWLRIASAAVVFAIWRRPWRYLSTFTASDRWTVIGLGASLAAMNSCFYLAINVLPLAIVGAIEFVGPIVLAALGVRRWRNFAALIAAIAGIAVLTDVHLIAGALGYLFAFANCVLFMLYIVLGHRISGKGGIDRLGISMLVAMVAAFPVGIRQAAPAFLHPQYLAAAVGVGISSSVIPYVTDQLAMARLPRATFALMLSILPAMATVIGFFVLRQIPTPRQLAGICLVSIGVAVHRSWQQP
jgi:inner membrane transporter RhtA